MAVKKTWVRVQISESLRDDIAELAALLNTSFVDAMVRCVCCGIDQVPTAEACAADEQAL